MKAKCDVAVDPTAKFWLHRKLGSLTYTKYILPVNSKLLMPSGEIVGPFCYREMVKFLFNKSRTY